MWLSDERRVTISRVCLMYFGNGRIFGEYGTGFVSEAQAELLRHLMEWIEGIKGNGAISRNIKGSFRERKTRILWANDP